ncbi:histidine kinase [Ruminococcus sp. OA3]|uniref:sensor histidine kinase n=1 Tax=Ruminococcus sp. OA3 TaxID=2914164 RepID=UPI001F066DE0|nr:histidine kinase [Ruminococcus sp. OA3]MCH1982702.1 histidine kinase [Ruminococcus sp. OA3]
MRSIASIFLLFAYSMFTVQFTEITPVFILSFLICISVVCSCSFMGKKSRLIILLIYSAASWFIPQLLLFLPAVTYALAGARHYSAAVLCAFSLFRYCIPGQIVLLLFILLGCMTSMLLFWLNHAYQCLDLQFKRTRDDTTELNLLLQQKNQSLRDKQDYEIYTATLRERNRIAREIHDNVGHLLTRSILMTGALKAISREPVLTPSLDQLEDTLSSAMDNIRSSVHDLHDESINMEEAVKSLIAEFSFCPVRLDYDITEAVPRDLKYGFISILKEALANIMKHSNATSAHIILREHPALYQLLIEDNGASGKPLAESGIGLINMRDRIWSLNGNIQISNDNGFRIFITVPKQI